MRIALISFEFPPAVAIGGIGAYAWEAARMLAAAGHEVEVFAAGKVGDEPAEEFGIPVHRIDAAHRDEFRELLPPRFSRVHRRSPFDLMESPEIGAEGAAISRHHPDLPYVVKLHTPTYLVGEIGYESPSFAERARFSLGALRRGRWRTLKPASYSSKEDIECLFARGATEVAAPSRAIGERVASDWSLEPGQVATYPYPFSPSPELLGQPLPTSAQTVGFLGRLEARKGVVELAHAIPSILEQYPDLRFRFIGPSWPFKGAEMEDYVRQVCRRHLSRIEFTGPVPRTGIPDEIRSCDIVVLPSRWENFPFACWEMMAAGRAVIGSNAGGMADVIQEGESGLLIPPRNAKAIADAVLSLAGNSRQVASLGAAARQRVLNHLHPERILPIQIGSYQRAIDRASALTVRNKR
jgi:glycogen(starch) synthase